MESEGTDPSCVTRLMGAGPLEGASARAIWHGAICFGELFVRRERIVGGVGTRRCGSAGRLALPREMRWWPAGGCKKPMWQGRPRPCSKAEAALPHHAHVVLQLALLDRQGQGEADGREGESGKERTYSQMAPSGTAYRLSPNGSVVSPGSASYFISVVFPH